jgi:hypothetical protein
MFSGSDGQQHEILRCALQRQPKCEFGCRLADDARRRFARLPQVLLPAFHAGKMQEGFFSKPD